MNYLLEKNLNIIKNLQNFMYDTKFADLKIYSKQYLSSTIYNLFNNVPTENFSLCFGDFDKIRDINDKYSMEIGDKVMHDGLKLIKDILPPSTIISRISGDEFLFINDNISKKEFDKYIAKINNEFKNNSDSLYGLNMTMSAMDTNISNSFTELYDLAEMNVGIKKKKSHINNEIGTKEEILYDKILKNFRNYFNYYRLNEKNKNIPLPDEYFLTVRDSLINIIINRLEKPDSSLELYMQKINNSFSKDNVLINYCEFPRNSAKLIHNLVTNCDLSNIYSIEDVPENYVNMLKQINISDLKLVKNFLISEPLTGQFSKTFFKNSLVPHFLNTPEKNVSVRMFDLVHLKLSNDITSHIKTDEKISELFNNIIQELTSKVDYSDFEHITGNFLISYGSKLISIEENNSTFTDEEINKILNKSRRNQRILNVVTAKQCGSTHNIINIVNNLTDKCFEQKHDLKVKKISAKETIVPLNIALNDSINYYLNNFSEPYSISNKQFLINNLFTGLTEVISERYPNRPNPNHNYNSTFDNSSR